jgi:2,5-diketo-D-gluconate reductase A
LLVDVPSVELNNGVHMPQLGFGTGQDVLQAGYRSVEAGLDRTGVPRRELFVTAIVEPGHFAGRLAEWGLDYVDLCLLPAPAGEFVQAWKAFEKFAADGRARAIGVAGFQIPDLRRLSEETGTVPAVNRVTMNPANVHADLRAYLSEHGITTQAVNPLGDLVDNDEVGFMAQKYGKSPAEILLRWHLELHHVIRADRPDHVAIFDFELAEDDVHALSELD